MLVANSNVSAGTRQVAPETGVNQNRFLSRVIMFDLKPLYIERAERHTGYVVLY